MIQDADQIKYNLDVVEKMISLVEKQIRSNENIMGIMSSSFEYETYFGYAVDEDKINALKANVEMLPKLIKYRSDLLNYAAGINDTAPDFPTDLPQDFTF